MCDINPFNPIQEKVHQRWAFFCISVAGVGASTQSEVRAEPEGDATAEAEAAKQPWRSPRWLARARERER